MIKLHKLNGSEIVVNADLIESLEAGQGTVVSLTTGNRFLVTETPDDVIARVTAYRKAVGAGVRVVGTSRLDRGSGECAQEDAR